MIWQADLHIMDHGNSWITSERLKRQSKTYQTGSVRQDIWDKTDLGPASGRDRNCWSGLVTLKKSTLYCSRNREDDLSLQLGTICLPLSITGLVFEGLSKLFVIYFMWALNWKAHFQLFSFEKTRQTNPSSPLSYASLESTTEETLPKRLKLLQSSCKKRFRILRFNLKSSVTGSCYVGLTSRERGTSEEYFICSLSKYLFLAKSIPWVYASEWAIEMKAVIKNPTTYLHVRGKQGHLT